MQNTPYEKTTFVLPFAYFMYRVFHIYAFPSARE